MHCTTRHMPFGYSCFPVGANSHKLSTWEPLIRALWNRLGSLNNRYVSFERQIILNNYMFISILIFCLQYLKMLLKVWRSIFQIQMNFLQGGSQRGKEIPQVRWFDVFKPKNDIGLGIKDLRILNLSLFGKWRLRSLFGGQDLQLQVLVSRYDNQVSTSPCNSPISTLQCLFW